MTLVLNGTTGVSAVDGSASTPAIQGNDSNTGIFFPAADTIAFAEGGAEVARFDSSGNFGIGTSSPTARLHVSAPDGTAPLTLNTAGGSDSTRALNFNVAGDNYGKILVPSGSGGAMAFWTGGANAAAERARIDSSGNLLVGITSTGSTPTYGAAYIAGDRSVGSGNYYAQVFVPHNSTTNHGIVVKELAASGIALAFLNSSNSVVGSITTTNTATAYNTSSDYRLKEQVEPMTGALARVTALKPVTYKWKVDGSNGEGFIAHELAEVVPQCVTGEKDAVDADGNPVYQGIDTSFLVATLTAAIQELKAEVDALKAQLESQV